MQSANCYLDEEYIYINFHYDLVIFTRPSWQGHMINCCTDILHFLICVIFVAFLPHFLMQFLMSTISQLCSTLLCCLVSLTKTWYSAWLCYQEITETSACLSGWVLVGRCILRRPDHWRDPLSWRLKNRNTSCMSSVRRNFLNMPRCNELGQKSHSLHHNVYMHVCSNKKNWTPTKMAIILQRLVISFVTPVQ